MRLVSSRARVAVVGYGLAGSVFHAPIIANTPGLSLDAIVTSDTQRQSQAAERYPGVRVTATADELLRRPEDLDLIVVAVPNHSHYAMAEQVVQAGISTVVDKPITPTSAEASRLAAIGRARGVSVIPYHNRRWDGDFLTVAGIISEGRLGEIHRFESRFERWAPRPAGSRLWKQDPNLPGNGILFDLGSHLVDQVVRLFGRPCAVYAELLERGSQVDNDAFVVMRYTEAIVVHLWASSTAAQPGPRFRILGSKGAFVKYGLDPQENALRAGRLPTEPHWGEEPASAWGRLGAAGDTETIPTQRGAYQDFYRAVAIHLLEGGPVPVDIDDAIVGLRVLEAAVQSARSRAVVALEPVAKPQ
jgi:scyllo-inositol 2-dehydrogenase (NADP+)